MFKIIYPIKQTSAVCSKKMHMMRHEWNAPVRTTHPYEANPDSTVNYPYYQIIRAQPAQHPIILKYLRNNTFQDDPILGALKYSDQNPNIEELILNKLKVVDTVMAVSSCPDQNILGVAMGEPFGTLENELVYKLSLELNDKGMKKYMDYVTHVKYLHDIYSYLGTRKVWDLCFLSTDRSSRGYGVGQMLVKQMLVLGKERGHRYCRFDTVNSMSTIIAKNLRFKLRWSVDFKDFADYYHGGMRGIVCPHSGISVFTQNLYSKKSEKYEKEVYAFNEKCRLQLIQHYNVI